MRWLILFLPLLALSHELWIEKEREGYVLFYGHIKPKGGEESKIPYKPEQVENFDCYDNSGKKVFAKLIKEYPARLLGKCSVVLASFSSGYWSRTTEGLKNLPKDKATNVLESWLSLESVKRIDLWNQNFSKPLTSELEIVLLENPLTIKPGQKFTVAVYYRGKPLKDVVVEHMGKAVGTTDEEGRINLRLREKGLQMIGASMKEKGDGVKADYVIRTSYLVFEVR
jgi:nickel transport protein